MANPPLNLTLSLWQGQTFNDTLSMQDSVGAPVDLTGFSARMMARLDIEDAVPLLTWSTTTGEIVLGGVLGTITFAVSAAATVALSSTNDLLTPVYDLVLSSSTGITERVIQGVLVIYPGVTR